MLFENNSIVGHYSGSNTRSNSGLIFDSSSTSIPSKWMIRDLIWQVLGESSYTCFTPFVVQSQVITSKMADSASIFASRSSNSTSIHQFYDSTLLRLRTRPCAICLENEPRVGTPICRNLTSRNIYVTESLGNGSYGLLFLC